jgi:hypothetical protein
MGRWRPQSRHAHWHAHQAELTGHGGRLCSRLRNSKLECDPFTAHDRTIRRSRDCDLRSRNVRESHVVPCEMRRTPILSCVPAQPRCSRTYGSNVARRQTAGQVCIVGDCISASFVTTRTRAPACAMTVGHVTSCAGFVGQLKGQAAHRNASRDQLWNAVGGTKNFVVRAAGRQPTLDAAPAARHR